MNNLSLSALTSPALIKDLEATTKREALMEIIDLIGQTPHVTNVKAFEKAVFEREKLTSTGIGLGIAVPHAKIAAVSNYVMAIGRQRKGIEYDSIDSQKVELIFLVGASDKQAVMFVRLLASIVNLIKNESVRQAMLDAPDTAAIYDVIRDWEKQHSS